MPDQTDVEKESERTNDLPSESSENPHDNETVQADRTISRVSTAGSIWITEKMSLPREALLVGVICMAQFCTQGAFMSTLVLLREIGDSFHVTSAPRLAWLVGGYSLTVGTFILFSGRLGDVFGYRRIMLTGLAWFSLWSMVAGVSVYSNYTLAVFSRVLQGIGPALCLPNALAILGAAYPPGHRKAMVFAFFGAVAPIGAVTSTVFATLLARVWWPWALWVLSIWLAVMVVVGRFAIPDLPRPMGKLPSGWKQWSDTLDIPGAVVGVVALILFNFAWTQAAVSGWATATIIVPLVLGVLLFGLFVYIEFYVSKMPLLPFEAVNTNALFVLGAVACGWATFGTWTLYQVQILQEIRHLSPLLTTAWFAPVTVAGACAAVFTGKLLGPWQFRPATVMTMALLAFFTGVTLSAFCPADQVYWGQTFVAMIVMPFGMDMSFPAATLILSNAVPKRHQGVAASLVNTVVNYGIALGVGFAGTVEVHVQGDPGTSDGVLRGLKGGLYMGMGLAGLGVAVCFLFLIKEFKLFKRGAAEKSAA